MREPYINAKIGHREYGKGKLIGWNPTNGMGCGSFAKFKLTVVSRDEYGDLWWLIEGTDSAFAPETPQPTATV